MRWVRVLVLLGALVLAGCRGSSEAIAPEDANVDMSLSVAPEPPTVGEVTLVVSLRTADGEPISGASIDVRGDMNHAGMEAVLADASTDVSGDYRVPFEWTMGGDWFVVVTATLPDGQVVEQQFDYTVAGEGPMDMDDDSGGMSGRGSG